MRVGDESGLMLLGATRAKLVFCKGATVGTVDVETLGGDALVATTQIAQIVAARL